jgi:hypothetical protein
MPLLSHDRIQSRSCSNASVQTRDAFAGRLVPWISLMVEFPASSNLAAECGHFFSLASNERCLGMIVQKHEN